MLRTRLNSVLSAVARVHGTDGPMNDVFANLWTTEFTAESNSSACMRTQAIYALISSTLQCFALREIAREAGIQTGSYSDSYDASRINHAKQDLLAAFESRPSMSRVILGMSTGTITSSAKGTASEGQKYILRQLKIPSSAYRMPSKDASQDKWETWFSKETELPNQFDISVSSIMFMFTGHLDNTHRPTYGCQDEVQKLTASGTHVTLERYSIMSGSS